MAVSAASYDAATNFELCVWVWVTPDKRLQTSTSEGCWLVHVMDPDQVALVDTIRIPARNDRMPDFSHPAWPSARNALERLRGTSRAFLA